MQIFVCRGYSGQIFRLDAADIMPMTELLPVMANSIGLYSSHEERLGVYNLTQDFEYRDGDTLEGRGTREGDLLIVADGGVCHKR